MKRILRSASETKLFAARLAKKIIKAKSNARALVLGLVGDLGSGKTTFIQGFIKALGVKRRIVSPSFLIFRAYPTPKRIKTSYKRIYHVDCYRLHKADELGAIDFKNILNNPENIVLIEWADKIRRRLPKNTEWLILEHGQKISERVIKTAKLAISHHSH